MSNPAYIWNVVMSSKSWNVETTNFWIEFAQPSVLLKTQNEYRFNSETYTLLYYWQEIPIVDDVTSLSDILQRWVRFPSNVVVITNCYEI